MGRVIAITSGKGGAGKSTISSAICDGLTRLGRRVAAVDGDMGLRNLDIMFGIQNTVVYDVADVIEHRCALDAALCRTPLGVTYLAAANRLLTDREMERFRYVIAALRDHFDYVVIDCGAGLGGNALDAALCAEEVIIVTTPEETAIRDAERVSNALRSRGLENQRLIINKLNMKYVKWGKAPDMDSIIDSVAVRLLGIVPSEMSLSPMQNSGKSVFDSDLRAVAKQLADICMRLDGKYVPLRKVR